jgi:hypothetical protein
VAPAAKATLLDAAVTWFLRAAPGADCGDAQLSALVRPPRSPCTNSTHRQLSYISLGDAKSSLGGAKSSLGDANRWVTLIARWVTLRARWVTLRARWVTLRARWVTLRACWVMLRARWVTLRARWMTLRPRWVTLIARWVTTPGAHRGGEAHGAPLLSGAPQPPQPAAPPPRVLRGAAAHPRGVRLRGRRSLLRVRSHRGAGYGVWARRPPRRRRCGGASATGSSLEPCSPASSPACPTPKLYQRVELRPTCRGGSNRFVGRMVPRLSGAGVPR